MTGRWTDLRPPEGIRQPKLKVEFKKNLEFKNFSFLFLKQKTFCRMLFAEYLISSAPAAE
ncbi:hypothetical protein C7B69_09065 [filamentous cyanobacterium Phorm 46]|nr:hypothetical protein C7B69_09065 [filamentous cyanobacterium Phorm 46]PSB44289.1 hypothetical protein C7B67_22785 [filamentous cyanobacterium Phorm 6]